MKNGKRATLRVTSPPTGWRVTSTGGSERFSRQGRYSFCWKDGWLADDEGLVSCLMLIMVLVEVLVLQLGHLHVVLRVLRVLRRTYIYNYIYNITYCNNIQYIYIYISPTWDRPCPRGSERDSQPED